MDQPNHLLNPVDSAQFLAAIFLAILFLQSGLDKVVDFGGNLSWLQGHFAKSPLAGFVKPMLVTITLTETVAGLVCAIGAGQVALSGETGIALRGAQLAAANIVMLFFGQRLAKDYPGAATLAGYFVLAVGAVLLMSM
jgi:uncharacterized membrane protein YphA (DoxX/SURF4 family)